MTTPVPSPDAATLAAVLAAVQAEQVAAFGYGTLGPRLTAGANVSQAHTFELAHRDLAAGAIQLITPGAPSASPGSYQLPVAATDDASARQLAVALETACATAWRFTLAQLAGTAPETNPVWTFAVGALRDSAVRAVTWRLTIDPTTASVAFPGI
jgi:hypothetical protein